MKATGAAVARAGLALLLAMLLATFLPGCGSPADPAAGQITVSLASRAGALLARDEAGWLGALEGPARERAHEEFTNLREVPLASFEYRTQQVHRHGDTAVAEVELRYRIEGHDRVPVTQNRQVSARVRGGHWQVTGDERGRGVPPQLWEQGPVTAVRTQRVLLLGVGHPREQLDAMADEAQRAVPAVSAAWPEPWAERTLVLVPASLQAMAELLGSSASSYRGMGAVTTGQVGSVPAPSDRVVVNPEAYAELSSVGRRVILTHETVHVATRTATTASTPLWLSEGFADWVAYRGTSRPPAEAAPALREALSAGEQPGALPVDAAFSFSGDGDGLARAYEGSWLAVRLIAQRWGEERLARFYCAVGAHPQRAGAVESALAGVLGTDLAGFTADWRAAVRAELG
ncbi:hypothetical protein [Streptomyces sp. NPDC006879]|uniref:hypothetical protein n=1 Tax=Streptomyces sp. NPDC006879 TaxID=3364767 RepID=UPI0036A056EF